jgi:1,4-alpha-glucan branching enzyme
MHDTLDYFKHDPVHRKYHHELLTFRGMYQNAENYVLPLSHDEVVHLKGSLISRMPGDDWQKFANVRLLLANQWTQPGKKLLFMGGEFGQWHEWNHDRSLDWHLTADESMHVKVQKLVERLNRVYREFPALHEGDCADDGFEWIDPNDADRSVISFLRRTPANHPDISDQNSENGNQSPNIADERSHGHEPVCVAVVLNYTPVPRFNYRIGVPRGGIWRELLNTDAVEYGGSGHGNLGQVEAAPVPWLGKPYTLTLTLPPLGALILAPQSTELPREAASPRD